MSKDKGLGIPALPQVNLLPPEIRAKRAAGTAKRWLGLAVVIALAIGVLGYGYAFLDARTARQGLATAEAETQALIAEQASLAHVPRVLQEWDNVIRAQNYAMVGEVLWTPYLQALTAVMPQNIGLGGIYLSSVLPSGAVDQPENALHSTGVGMIRMTGSAVFMSDTEDWIEALRTIPGLRDVYYYQQPISLEDDVVYFEWEITVIVDPSALSLRHLVEEDAS